MPMENEHDYKQGFQIEQPQEYKSEEMFGKKSSHCDSSDSSQIYQIQILFITLILQKQFLRDQITWQQKMRKQYGGKKQTMLKVTLMLLWQCLAQKKAMAISYTRILMKKFIYLLKK